ncbi:sensor histidine kinase [Devosia sp.]|uniref:sensor histidine kinase n=1 Tax=Devosia sp. TaxID=1871048 RepID=UPI002EEE2F49
MGIHQRWEAADSVIAGAVLLVAVILAIFTFLCVQGYDNTIREAKARAERSAAVVGLGSRWMILSILSSLDATTASGGGQADSIKDSASQLPADVTIAVYDAAGRAQGEVDERTPSSIAEREYFRVLANGQEWALGAQEATAAGRTTFAIARRIVSNGQFSGAIVASIDTGLLETLSAPQDLGPGSTVSLVREDGWVIARNPPLAEPTNLNTSPAMEQIRSAPAGSYSSNASPVDGVSRLVGFSQVPDLGYIAIASIATDTALAGLWYAIWVVSLLLAPIALAVLVGSLMTARLLRKTQSAQRSLTKALDHNEALFREIHHRVKNNLQSINSLLQIHPIPPEVRADISKRIFAMSAVHEHIYRSSDFGDVRVRDYLHTLIQNIRDGADPKVEINEDLHDVVVDKDAAAPLGLILSEVLTNSLKHAFVGRDHGNILVSLKQVEPELAALVIVDDGSGYDPTQPSKGIGRRLVHGFAAQLNGEVRYSGAQGARFSMRFPSRPPQPKAL